MQLSYARFSFLRRERRQFGTVTPTLFDWLARTEVSGTCSLGSGDRSDRASGSNLGGEKVEPCSRKAGVEKKAAFRYHKMVAHGSAAQSEIALWRGAV
jgi:hypothetical protein